MKSRFHLLTFCTVTLLVAALLSRAFGLLFGLDRLWIMFSCEDERKTKFETDRYLKAVVGLELTMFAELLLPTCFTAMCE